MTDSGSRLQEELNLRDYLRILRRRRRAVFVSVAACLLVALLYIVITKPVYESTAQLLVEDGSREYTRDNTGEPFGDVMTLPGHDVLTQMEVLKGHELLTEAYAEAGVPWKAAQVDVKRVFDTDVLSVSAQSRNPRYASQLASVLPGAYIRFATDTRRREITNALDFGKRRLDQENTQLRAAELALQRFRDSEGVTDLDKQREAGINESRSAASEVNRLRQEIAGAEARLTAMLAYRHSLPSVTVAPTSVTNPSIAVLKDRLATLQNERTRVTVLYKPSNTRVQEIDAQIADLQKRLARTPATVTTITKTRNSEVGVVDQRIADQRALLDSRRQELAAASRASGSASASLERYAGLQRRQDELIRDIDNHKAAVSLLVSNVESLGIRAKAAHSPASIVSEAGPVRRVAPRKLNALAAALLGGLLLGFGAALFIDHIDERIQTHGDARSVLGSPVVGVIPSLADVSPLGLPEESYRTLRANVQFAALDRPLRSLLVCSTLAGEGKTTTALNLAVAMAVEGKRVVLIDADLRSPSVHERLATPAYPGLSDILLDRISVPLALHPTSIASLSVIPAGRESANAVDALTLSAVGALQGSLREYCDVAVFDGPPLLEASEAQVLAAGLDAVLYVVELGGTPRPMLVQAGELLVQARAHVLGIVANRAETESGSYGYGKGAGRYREQRRRMPGLSLPLPGAGSERRKGV